MTWSRIEKLFDEGLNALRRERYNEAVDRFTEAMDLDPQLPQIHYNMGLALAGLYRWRDALACFDMANRIKPHPDFWVHRGLALLRLRRWESALESFERALDLEPSSEIAHAHRDDLVRFLSFDQRSPEAAPFLCVNWFDKRLEDFVGVDPVIVPKEQRGEIRGFIAERICDEVCDHSFLLTEEWALRRGLDPVGLGRFLYSRGMRCDCEVLAER